MWNGDQAAEEAFLLRSDEQQATDLQAALMRYDGAPNKAGAQQAAPTNGQAGLAQMAPAQMQPVAMIAPAAMGAQSASVRSPSTVSDPNNTGAKTVSNGSPQAATSAAAPQVLVALQSIHAELKKANEELENCSGQGDLEDLKSIVLGMSRTQQHIGVLLLMLAETQLQLPANAISNMVKSELNAGRLKELFPQDNEGKAD